jgi:FkbM family methyltransferase
VTVSAPFWRGTSIQRCSAAWTLLNHATDTPSRLGLLHTYARALSHHPETSEITLQLRVGSTIFPLRIRWGDIYTLEEVFHQVQYKLSAPLPAQPVIVDVGAHIGVSALWFLAQYAGARLIAIEPEPENLRLLSVNLRAQPGTTVVPAAATSHNGEVTLFTAAQSAMHSLIDHPDSTGHINVPAIRLDHYLGSQGIGWIDLLKMDVEGSEMTVLEGLGALLNRVGRIVGEVHEGMVDSEIFYQMLTTRGFRVIRRSYFGSGRADGVHTFEAERCSRQLEHPSRC